MKQFWQLSKTGETVRIVFQALPEVDEYKLKELFEQDAANNGGTRTYFQWDPAKVVKNVFLTLPMQILVLHSHTAVLLKQLL